MTREQAINYLISRGLSHEQVGDVVRALTYEPTTKNNLGVDCISREQALVAIRNLYPGMPRVDFNGSLRKWVDKYKPYIECDDAIKELPSVTLQEPRWIPVSERYPKIEDEYKYFLVTDDKGKVSVQEFFMSLDEEPQPYFSGMLDVTAWMPLPQPYREVKG